MPHLLPPSASPDVRRIVCGRALRGFADGFVSVLLAQYLVALGFSPVQVGAITTGTLLGSAVLTLVFGLRAHRIALRTLLLTATGMMVLTGIGFTTIIWFWPLFLLAVIGTLNPSAGDVSVFLPTEQAFVASHVDVTHRSRIFARYNLAGTFAGALGALLSGVPEALAQRRGWEVTTAQRTGFVLYTIAALVILGIYVGLRTEREVVVGATERKRALHSSRRTVLELAALFSIDSAGSGFVVTSMLVLWLNLRFELSAATTGAVFAAAGLLGALSQFLAPRLADRIGFIRTMTFTHIPANLLLASAAFAPTGGIAIALLLARALFAQMDVPARQAFVMAVVPADERAAASSVTNVPRSLASATTPLLASILLQHTTFGWPLIIAGATKITYDLVLLGLYRDVPEEVGASRVRR